MNAVPLPTRTPRPRVSQLTSVSTTSIAILCVGVFFCQFVVCVFDTDRGYQMIITTTIKQKIIASCDDTWWACIVSFSFTRPLLWQAYVAAVVARWCSSWPQLIPHTTCSWPAIPRPNFLISSGCWGTAQQCCSVVIHPNPLVWFCVFVFLSHVCLLQMSLAAQWTSLGFTSEVFFF